MGLAYYNENDRFAAAWLRNLINAGHIAPGVVDDRSIEDITPADLDGFTQCHFLAGIGGWSYALRLADWPDDRPCWTGSCPCQPFRASFRTTGVIGFSDRRHLWPYWYSLIEKRRPSDIFGEQVMDAVRYGWLDLVQDQLEEIGYACGAVGISAAGVGAPHRRERLYWVAQSGSPRLEGYAGGKAGGGKSGWQQQKKNRPVAAPGQTDNFWSGWAPVECEDGVRPVQPGTFPLAHGVSNCVGRLRGYGNAIVPQVAAEFVRAYMESHSAADR